jgi:carbonic anhydrase
MSRGAKPGPDKVREILSAGNDRFRRGRPEHPRTGRERRELAAGGDQAEHALATVLACSDSRAPVERIFDAGIMDLFVVRVAGQVLGESVLASLEYGVLHVHTPLLVVLGHTGCGAVTAALARERGGPAPAEEKVGRLVERISPAARRALQAAAGQGPERELELAVEENVRQAVAELDRLSPALCRAESRGEFAAAGAIYDLGTGRVRWL